MKSNRKNRYLFIVWRKKEGISSWRISSSGTGTQPYSFSVFNYSTPFLSLSLSSCLFNTSILNSFPPDSFPLYEAEAALKWKWSEKDDERIEKIVSLIASIPSPEHTFLSIQGWLCFVRLSCWTFLSFQLFSSWYFLFLHLFFHFLFSSSFSLRLFFAKIFSKNLSYEMLKNHLVMYHSLMIQRWIISRIKEKNETLREMKGKEGSFTKTGVR